MNDVASPSCFFGFVGSTRIYRGERDAELSENISVIVGHSVVSTHQHPPLVTPEPLDQRAKQRLVFLPMQSEFRSGNCVSPATLQLCGDAVVDVGIDN